VFKKSSADKPFKSRFSSGDWTLVMAVPFIFAGGTAAADGTIDAAEAAELQRRMQTGALGYKDPLHREVAREFFSTPVTIDQLMTRANTAGPEKVRSVLQKTLSHDEYQGYVGSVFLDAVGVAQASGGVSGVEMTTLNALAAFFAVDVPGLQSRFGS
jgi:uncharacterized membrane protein YebE (DUF533 family)